MLNQNICRFITQNGNPETIRIINFVLETHMPNAGKPFLCTVYQAAYVLEGSAVMHLQNRQYSLQPGDVFFCFPSKQYLIEPDEKFKYLYISYIGTYAQQVMDRYSITPQTFLFHDLSFLESFWLEAIRNQPQNIGINSLSVLLYTLTQIGFRTLRNESPDDSEQEHTLAERVIQYIDGHYSDPGLSVYAIAGALSYNAKYVSGCFRKATGFRISEYVNEVRIQQAMLLIERNFTSVSDIASFCGFSNPMYFSKVFKAKKGISPREQINEHIRSQNSAAEHPSADGDQKSESLR